MGILKDDEILGEKSSSLEKIIQEILKAQNDGVVISEQEISKVGKLVQSIKDNPRLLNFIEKKYIEDLGAWIVEKSESILKEKSQKIKRDKNGYVLLDETSFINREHHGQGKMADKWYILDNKEFLSKDLFSENQLENTLIAEEIARQLNLPVALYFPAKEKEKDEDGKEKIRRKILSLNFLGKDENLKEGNCICEKQMDIVKVEEILKDYLYKNKEKPENVASIITNYKKFLLYSILINHRDAHNGNWGLVENKKGRYKFAPIYDLEGALSENTYKIRAFNCNGNYDDDSILDYLLQDSKILEFAKSFDNLNMDEVYNKVYTAKKVQVSDELKEKNNKVINEQKELIKRKILERENKMQNNRKQEK